MDLEKPKIDLVPVKDIRTGQFELRKSFDREAQEELTASIKQMGILQPVILKRLPEGGYGIVAGARRFTAAREAGLEAVPAIITDVANEDQLGIALTEKSSARGLNSRGRA
jgi:ParB family chromosome partitioning protein